ncbi:MAG: TetR/AcrR family transcriptional regulator [Proteobacteria bacterium]|nr:TetR/AcrR family transcriptional regulator [Pseudomonadota bacterium]
MPPKTRFSREVIIDVAFNIVRWNGWEALSARAVAEELKSSTMPVYFHFKSMENLEEEIVKRALTLQLEYQDRSYTGDRLLDLGVGYVTFANEESHLFRGINERKHSHLLARHGQNIFDLHWQALAGDPRFERFTDDQRRRILMAMWFFVHGLAHLSISMPLDEYDDYDLPRILGNTTAIFFKGLNIVLDEELERLRRQVKSG